MDFEKVNTPGNRALVIEAHILFLRLFADSVNAKMWTEMGEVEAASQAAELMVLEMRRMTRVQMVGLIGLLFDQLVGQIHARCMPDGTLRDLYTYAHSGNPIFVGSLAGAMPSTQKEE